MIKSAARVEAIDKLSIEIENRSIFGEVKWLRNQSVEWSLLGRCENL